MTDKKFSDFTSTNRLQENEYLATELLGVENRKITLNDFANQIQDRLLKLSFSDVGSFKASVISPADNKQPNLLHCDGAIWYASNTNTLIAKFINAMYENSETRELFNIPADKSSMKLPDLRDRHLVGSGSMNPVFSYPDSKVMDILSGITAVSSTSMNTVDNHTHPINDITGYFSVGDCFINTDTSGAFTYTSYAKRRAGSNQEFEAFNGVGFSSHRAGVYGTNGAGSHYHIATTTTDLTINKNTAVIDNITRVPAFVIYWYIDIAVDRFTLDPNASDGIITIDISQVNGLQTALDSKVDDGELTNYATTIALDTGLNGKADTVHTHIVDDITGLQLILDDKANTIHNHLIGDLKFDDNTSLENWLSSTYAPINHTHNINSMTGLQDALESKLDTTTYSSDVTTQNDSIEALNTTLSKYNSFGIKYTKSGLTQTIVSNATELTNIINIVNNEPTIFSWAVAKDGSVKPSVDLISVDNGFKLPIIDGLINYGLSFNIRITGVLSGSSATAREFIFYLRRLSDNSIVANDGIIKVADNNINGSSVTIASYVVGALDPFIRDGFYIDMLNNGGSSITLEKIELYIEGR